MLRRFVAGTAIASVLIACGAMAILLVPALGLPQTYPLAIVWCFVPLAWGLWAMLAPAAWVPDLLPIWGAFLGFIAGVLAAFVLNMPSGILGETIPAGVRGLGVVVMVTLYYWFWILVMAAYRALGGASPAKDIIRKAA